MNCLDENALMDVVQGRRPIVGDVDLEAHLAGCADCAHLLGVAMSGSQATGSSFIATSASGTLAVGELLKDTYRVVRLVGRGGMGEVYEVAHVRLAGRYAIKVMRAEVTEDDERLVRFRREAAITSSLRHPNIVQVIDFDRTPDGRVFLAMEYLDGRDLRTLLREEGPLPLRRVVPIVEQMADALSAVHRHGVVHRDLKPENVFVLTEVGGSDGRVVDRVKLVDFGVSKWQGLGLDEPTQMSRDQVLIGTPRYMAPEQARGTNREIGPAADQFALAAIVYELLTGAPAFPGDTVPAVLHAIVYETPRPVRITRPEVPAVVAQAIGRAMSKPAQERFDSVSGFVTALKAGEGGAAQKGRGRWLPLALAGSAAAGALVLLILGRPAKPSVPIDVPTNLSTVVGPRQQAAAPEASGSPGAPPIPARAASASAHTGAAAASTLAGAVPPPAVPEASPRQASTLPASVPALGVKGERSPHARPKTGPKGDMPLRKPELPAAALPASPPPPAPEEPFLFKSL